MELNEVRKKEEEQEKREEEERLAIEVSDKNSLDYLQ
jgi:hypothetical protein